MPINLIPFFLDESSISKRINMTSVFDKKMQLAMPKTAPDLKNSVQNIKVQFIEVGRAFDSSGWYNKFKC